MRRLHDHRMVLAWLLAWFPAGCLAEANFGSEDASTEAKDSSKDGNDSTIEDGSTSGMDPGGMDDPTAPPIDTPSIGFCQETLESMQFSTCGTVDALAPEGFACIGTSQEPIGSVFDICSHDVFPISSCVLAPDEGTRCTDEPVCPSTGQAVYYGIGNDSLGVSPRAFASPRLCDLRPEGFEACNYDETDPEACRCYCPEIPGPELPSDPAAALARRGACLDLMLYARNDADTLGLELQLEQGLIEQVRELGEPASVTVALPGSLDEFAAPELYLLVGDNVTNNLCNDVFEEQFVRGRWRAMSGTLDVTVVPGDEVPLATVRLTDVTFAPDHAGEPFVLDTLELVDVRVPFVP